MCQPWLVWEVTVPWVVPGLKTIRSSGIGLGVERNNPSKYADRRDLRMQGGLLD